MIRSPPISAVGYHLRGLKLRLLEVHGILEVQIDRELDEVRAYLASDACVTPDDFNQAVIDSGYTLEYIDLPLSTGL